VGWQPSRFLSDRGEAERAFRLAERLGSVNAAAVELGTTWPSLRKAFQQHELGMPARNPEAVRQRALDAATQHAGQPAAPPLDPMFVALNHGQVPTPRGSHGEQGVRLRRAEEIETLSYRTVVELNAESRLAPSGGWSRSPAVPNAPNGWPPSGPAVPIAATSTASSAASGARPTVPAALTDPTGRRGRWLPMPADPIHPDQLGGQQRFRADLAAYLDSLPVPKLAERLGELPSSRQQPLQLGVLMVAVNERLPDAYKLLPPAGHAGPAEGRRRSLREVVAARTSRHAGPPPWGWPSDWPTTSGRPTCTQTGARRVRWPSGG
jgi:hypothetical protein